MRHKYIPNLLIIVALLSSTFCMHTIVYAKTNITNNISVKTNTGGNETKNNLKIEGDTKSSIDIKTTINGKTLEDIHKTSSEKNLKIKHTITANNIDATTTTQIQNISAQDDEAGLNRYRTNKSTTTKLSNIINNEESDKTIVQNDENNSFFEQIVITFSQTFAYVLSNFFTFSWTTK